MIKFRLKQILPKRDIKVRTNKPSKPKLNLLLFILDFHLAII